MHVTSSAYRDGGAIPPKHTCDGADVSPPWTVHDVPDGATHLAAVFDDPDAPRGTWDHWLAWDVPADQNEWPEGAADGLGVTGTNGWGKARYGGPCPPSGTHRYVLTVYALDAPLGLPRGADRAAMEAALEGRVVAEARLVGTYRR